MGKSYKQVSFVERALIQTQLVLRWSPAAIAAGLQRARTTVTCEMVRKGWQPEPKLARRGRPPVAGIIVPRRHNCAPASSLCCTAPISIERSARLARTGVSLCST